MRYNRFSGVGPYLKDMVGKMVLFLINRKHEPQASWKRFFVELERETGFEPATLSLEG
jgi:hypothetical protein